MSGQINVVEGSPGVPGTGADRRVHPRLTARQLRGLVSARLKYGREVQLLDLSVGGTLIEAADRIAADSNVVFEFAGPDSTILVPSRALRVQPLSEFGDTGRYKGAFAFKRPIALGELLKEPTLRWQRIAARYRDGRVIQGYTQDFQRTKRGLTVSPAPFGDVSREVTLSELDSIFFLRDNAFGKDAAQDDALGRRVAVTLADGETIVGRTPNSPRDPAGLFVHPADSSTALRVFVLPWAIRDLKFL